jgi:hypothetical protein
MVRNEGIAERDGAGVLVLDVCVVERSAPRLRSLSEPGASNPG